MGNPRSCGRLHRRSRRGTVGSCSWERVGHACRRWSNNAAEYRHLLDEMFRLRARVFRDRLKWDVVVTDGMERDRYDDEGPVYMIYTDEDQKTVRGRPAAPADDGSDARLRVLFRHDARRGAAERPLDLGVHALLPRRDAPRQRQPC